ncbi:MAG: hypothetical protein WDZ94_03640 [Patescibacteria group bacterium]
MQSNLLFWIIAIALGVGAYFWLNRSDVTTEQATEVTEVEDMSATDGVTVELSEQSDLGQSGVATLENNDDGMLVVTLSMTGGEFPEPQPAHIHLGACPDPGAVSYPLENVVDGSSVTTLDVSWEDLETAGEPLAINVHKSAAEASVYTACGDLPV